MWTRSSFHATCGPDHHSTLHVDQIIIPRYTWTRSSFHATRGPDHRSTLHVDRIIVPRYTWTGSSFHATRGPDHRSTLHVDQLIITHVPDVGRIWADIMLLSGSSERVIKKLIKLRESHECLNYSYPFFNNSSFKKYLTFFLWY